MTSRNHGSYPGNRTPSAPPLSPPDRQQSLRSQTRQLDIDPPIEDVYEQEERDAELARRLQAEEEAALAAISQNSYNNHHHYYPREEEPQIPQSSISTAQEYEYNQNSSSDIPAYTAYATPVEDTIEDSPILEDNHTNRSTNMNMNMNMASISQVETDEEYARRTADEELARRTQQELRDEAFAMELQRKEQDARRHHNHRTVVPVREYDGHGHGIGGRGRSSHPHRSRNQCNNRRIICAGIMAIIVGGAALCIVFFGSSIWQKLGGDVEDLPPFFQDPWDDNDSNGPSGEFSQWKNKGEGLELEIRNSLSTDWDSYFIEAVRDWNESPALSLTTKNIDIDPDCTSVQGIMKVCNNYYGKTGWTGLNEVYFTGSYIAASVAKMNESYLNGKGNAEKQYVMCHELGHGFGLPHRDENANNPDLGSCLDYTYRYENNKRPDAIVDFDNLLNIYGSKEGEGGKRNLRSSKSTKRRTQNKVKIAETTFPTITNTAANYKEGRLLHQSKHYEMYENDLGGGNRILTTVLLAQEE